MSDRRKRCEDLVALFARAPIKKTFGMSLSRHLSGPRDFFLRYPNLSEVLSPGVVNLFSSYSADSDFARLRSPHWINPL